MSDDLGSVTIGAREIYDELVAMRAEVQESTLTHAAVAAKLTDHEDRIRAVERWKYSPAVTLATSVLAAGVAVYTKLGKG